jgi:hypothetical protein
MINLLSDIFLYIYFATVVVAALIGTLYRKSFPYPLNWLWIYLWLDVFIELFVYTLRLFKISFFWSYNAFGPVEYFFISWLYLEYYQSAIEKNTIKILYLLYTFFVIYYMIYLNGFNEFHVVFVVRSMLMAALSLYYFLKIYRSDQILEITRSPLFWISTGLFIFCTGSIFTMGLGTSLIRFNGPLGQLVYLLNPLLNIYLYTLFIVSFSCSRRNPGFY